MSDTWGDPGPQSTAGHFTDPPRCAICGGWVAPSLGRWWIDQPAHAICVDDRRRELAGTADDAEREEYYRAAMADAHRVVTGPKRQRRNR